MIEGVVALSLLLFLVGGILWAGGGKIIHEDWGSGIIEAIPGTLEREPRPSQTLGVLSYNIAYGLGTHRDGPALGNRVAVYDRLDHIIEAIAMSGADVALLQEVDFDSRRTHGIDQLQHIASALGWGFAARAITWECRYRPWPPRRPLGRLRAGMGVISRYPLVQNTRQRLSQLRTYPLLAPLFCPYHTVQMVEVQCGAQTVRLFNVYLESRHMVTRQQQVRKLLAFIEQAETPVSVLAGSFNAAVAGTVEVEPGTAGTPDPTMAMIMDGLQGRFRLVADDGSTDSAIAPGSRLDHILTASGMYALEARVLAPSAPVSDHLPVVAHLRWMPPIVVSNGGHNHSANREPS